MLGHLNIASLLSAHKLQEDDTTIVGFSPQHRGSYTVQGAQNSLVNPYPKILAERKFNLDNGDVKCQLVSKPREDPCVCLHGQEALFMTFKCQAISEGSALSSLANDTTFIDVKLATQNQKCYKSPNTYKNSACG